MSEENAKRYKELNVKGDGGLVIEISGQDKIITTIYKLKGETKHSETIKMGTTSKVVGYSGKERNVRVQNLTVRIMEWDIEII